MTEIETRDAQSTSTIRGEIVVRQCAGRLARIGGGLGRLQEPVGQFADDVRTPAGRGRNADGPEIQEDRRQRLSWRHRRDRRRQKTLRIELRRLPWRRWNRQD